MTLTTGDTTVKDRPEKLSRDGKKYGDFKKGQKVRVFGLDGATCYDGFITEKVNATKQFKVNTGGSIKDVSITACEMLVADPFEQIHPMLAKNIDDRPNITTEAVLTSPQWALEEKYDGERQILTYFPQDERWRATTRVVSKVTGQLAENTGKLAHIDRLLYVPQMGNTVFDCELMHHGGFQALRSIMGSLDEKANERQKELGFVHAVIFDVLWFDGRDLRGIAFKQRRKVLESWYGEVLEFHKNNGTDAEFFKYVKLSPIAWQEDGKRNMLDGVLARGGEGAMVKFELGTYTDTTLSGRRSDTLLKIKPFTADEFILVGFEMGQGMYNKEKYGVMQLAQWVPRTLITEELNKRALKPSTKEEKAFIHEASRYGHYADYELVFMGTCGGFNDAEELEFRTNPATYLFKPVEVKFQSRWDETGLLRHANFMRLREDKSVRECIYTPKTPAVAA